MEPWHQEASRIDAAVDACRAVDTVLEQATKLRAVRQAAVIAAKAGGASWGELARALGVTRARVQQYHRGE